MEESNEPKINTEEIKITGEKLLEKVKQLLHEGNVRKIIIKNKGKVIMEVPMTIAAIGALVAPVLAAIGALAALVTECSIVVERKE
ncbi:MAG: DUF4342 domain-containing protein [Candidatus Margulisiibacteriota bacterium]|nr:DUF4342 domain-containing protein [Candidatus Margulisiibacteriota bacterium]